MTTQCNRLVRHVTGTGRPHRAGAFLAAMLSLCVVMVPAASAAGTASAVPAYCSANGPVVVTSVTMSVRLSACSLQGRQILMPMANGRLGVGVYVPKPGMTVANFTLTRYGEYELKAGNMKGVLYVTTVSPAAVVRARPDTDAACGENGFNTEGGFWQSSNAEPTELWYYNESTVSRAGLNLSATITDIRDGNYNMTTGQNNCGFQTGVFPVHGGFEGNTSLFANINSSGNCTSKFPDGQNTVSWGPFDSSASGTQAVTCTTWNSSSLAMIEADIYLGSNVGMVDSLPSNCSSAGLADLDLQTIVTHEWGHSYGLAHETSGPDEVMYPNKSYCQLRRHLGEGDYDGMASIYGMT